MEAHQVKRLPVIENHRLVGIISEADLARSLDEHRLAEFVKKVYATTRPYPLRREGGGPKIEARATTVPYRRSPQVPRRPAGRSGGGRAAIPAAATGQTSASA